MASPKPTAGKAQAPKSTIQCDECGHVFRRTITERTFEIRCPKCGGYDTLPVDFFGYRKP